MKRPANLREHYGWCTKGKRHGVIFDEKEGCHRCRTEKIRKAEDKCLAELFHGPGHQSSTFCSEKGKHTIHRCVYGSYRQEASWKGMSKCTGFFDEPPEGNK